MNTGDTVLVIGSAGQIGTDQVELHCGFECADEDAEVHDASGDAGTVEGLAFVADGPAVGFVLDDFDGVAVGVPDVEVGVFEGAFADFVRHLDAFGGEVGAHCFGVIDLNRDVIQTICAGCEFGIELDDLTVVDLDEGEEERAVGLVELEDFFEAEKVCVIGARFFDIVHEEGNMGDPQDTGTLGLLRLLSRKEHGREERSDE